MNALASDGGFCTNTLGAGGTDNGNTTGLSIGDETTRIRRVDDRDAWFVMHGKRPCRDARIQERPRKKLIHVAVILPGTSATVWPKCRSPMRRVPTQSSNRRERTNGGLEGRSVSEREILLRANGYVIGTVCEKARGEVNESQTAVSSEVLESRCLPDGVVQRELK